MEKSLSTKNVPSHPSKSQGVKNSQNQGTGSLAAPSPYNQSAWNNLPTLPQDSQGIEAVLVEFDISGKTEKPAWQFFINPKSISVQDKAVFSEVATHAARVTAKYYSHSSGARMTIADLRFSGWLWGKTVRPSLEGLQELLRCRPDKNEFSPKILMFVMGRRRFGPCVLEEVQWEESQWLGGDAAGIKLSLTLQEIPKPLTPAQKEERERQRQLAASDMKEAQGKPRLRLTPRQQQEVTQAAKVYLEANRGQFSDSVQALIHKGNYQLKTDSNTGAVTLSDAQGKSLGTVLSYDGKALTAGIPTTTVPLKTGGKLPTPVSYTIGKSTTSTSSTSTSSKSGGTTVEPPTTTKPTTLRTNSSSTTSTTMQSGSNSPFWVILTGGRSTHDEMVIKTVFEMNTKLNGSFKLGGIVSVSHPELEINTRAIGYPRTGWFSISYWDDQPVTDGIIKVEVIPG